MTTLIFPLSRIEGHAQVTIEQEGGRVLSARFQATELRGFEHFVKGIPAEQMPVIVPRICGVCSTAHHVASVKALEDAYGVTPPPLAFTLRELLMLGQLIQNQATSLFIFTMPDRLGVASLLPGSAPSGLRVESSGERPRSPEGVKEALGSKNSPEGVEMDATIAPRALQVRRAGTQLISAAGGQFIHPIKAVVGGMSGSMDPAVAENVRQVLERALPVACDLFDTYWELSFALRDRIGTWGDDGPAWYLAATSATFPEYNSDLIRLLSPTGQLEAAFPARNYRDYLTFQETDYSYAGQTTYRGEILRANSLARINLARAMGTPRADAYLQRFRAAFGFPAHAILLFDLCRGIELVYAIERAIELLGSLAGSNASGSPDDLSGWTAVSHTPRDGEGFGLVEAPRGPLIHHYVIENGRIARAEFIIPTVHNLLAIERALRVAAERYIQPGSINLELEKAVGRVVRAFDPCIACATH